MLGSIGFEKYRIRCIIGTREHERVKEQDILVDVQVATDISAAVASDKLTDTVDYSKLAALCREMAETGKYHLIEKYAADVAQAMCDRFPVQTAWVTVRKPGALEGADNAVVSVFVSPKGET